MATDTTDRHRIPSSLAFPSPQSLSSASPPTPAMLALMDITDTQFSTDAAVAASTAAAASAAASAAPAGGPVGGSTGEASGPAAAQQRLAPRRQQATARTGSRRSPAALVAAPFSWLAGSVMKLARAVVSPTANVISDVSLFYSRRLYRHLLRQRDPKRHFHYLMDIATSYEQWAAAGYMLDRCEGKDEWKNTEGSDDYDHGLVRDRLDMLRGIRKAGDTATMMFTMRTSLIRNLGDMGNPKLYGFTHVGTKALIEDYIDEVTKQLNFICDVDIPNISVANKLEFFTNIQKSFGRTALLLSGGGTFGLSHIGTVKALFEMKLLPKIITGSSGGAIVASVVCTRTDAELPILMDPRFINLDVFERPEEQNNTFLKIARLLKHGVLFDVQVFTDAMRQNLGDVTFLEAFNRTRRVLNITVSSSTNYEMPRLLNYLTAPNVDKSGVFVPWNPSGHRWIDGSVENDLPMQRISELFGVNHFIVAQVNPHIIPFMGTQNRAPTFVTNAVMRVGYHIQTELAHRLTQLVELGVAPSVLARVKSIICQKYYGDITVVPYIPMLGTWPKIAIMRNHCQIELCINQNILTLRQELIAELSRKAAAAAAQAAKQRIASKTDRAAAFVIGSPSVYSPMLSEMPLTFDATWPDSGQGSRSQTQGSAQADAQTPAQSNATSSRPVGTTAMARFGLHFSSVSSEFESEAALAAAATASVAAASSADSSAYHRMRHTSNPVHGANSSKDPDFADASVEADADIEDNRADQRRFLSPPAVHPRAGHRSANDRSDTFPGPVRRNVHSAGDVRKMRVHHMSHN
ncbi:hypothetical protein BC831DRAFT_475066 [Entophlyctis helioformis]|nr:hypothetical protein BC831DRAFT_475066 [Entophlyctis helioformis]